MIVLIFHLVTSVLIALVGRKRKFGFWGYFFASLLLTPAGGFLLLLASGEPQKEPRGDHESLS